MNRGKFKDMMEGVQASLEHLRDCEQDVRRKETALLNAQNDLEEARAEFNDARDAFHKEFPEMAPPAQVATADVQAAPAQPAVVEEAKPVPVMTPQGPVQFREMDDSPFGDGS